MAKVIVGNSGALEMFGPNGKPWRTANDEYLAEAIELANSDSTAALKLANELVVKAWVTGVIRFRCKVPAELTGEDT